MHWTRILGIALLVGGIILLVMGYNATESLGEELHQEFMGRYTEDTRMYLIAGGIMSVVGLVLAIFGVRR
ncbi:MULTISPECIES: DUF3185 family protein [Thioalkalivibrio]|uniref:Membrane protein n=1 Tax=Thioalkalivibrio versutus TaxID=106634 RepID=A0A0G3G0N6_9GAMM|nr:MULTISPECIES: DUF3185 family protein [Thioalkalivibrio]AKJ94773.1 membrane protein [Thioalkalivibrio versutus]OOC49144.1 hypothetical protein B0684_06515 [Thioalkalivibrio versutus]